MRRADLYESASSAEANIATIALRNRRFMAHMDPVSEFLIWTWRLLTNVRFAVFQILFLAVAGVVGAVLTQLPAYALHDPQAYVIEMAKLRMKYEALTVLGANVGPSMVNVFEWLGFFRVFSAPWFISMLTLLTVSIVMCTLNRAPKLWREARRVTIQQPNAFFDLRLHERARFRPEAIFADDLARVLRGRRFRVKSALSEDDSVAYLYGDRHQYVKLATLLTHLGLILFLIAGAVTVTFGFETVVFVGEGQTAPVQPIGTPHNMLVRNIHFAAPQRPDGSFSDFWTDLAVYRDGELVARKTIRVNDPLVFDGYYFHQNTFGPAADIEVRDAGDRLLWTGPVLLTSQAVGRPEGFFAIPGSPVGLVLVLDRDSSGIPELAIVGLGPATQAGSNELLFTSVLGIGEKSSPVNTGGYSIAWVRPGSFTGMVIKSDPGAPFVWTGFLTLMAGLLFTFYMPRRRVWAQLSRDGIQLAFIADRYVDAESEFMRLLDELAARTGQRPETSLAR